MVKNELGLVVFCGYAALLMALLSARATIKQALFDVYEKKLSNYNECMEKQQTQAIEKRKRGRPLAVNGAVVNVNLRVTEQDRETLRILGGAAWLRAQLAAVRSSGQALATVAAHKQGA